MSTKNDGGPAFPTDSEAQVGPNTWHYQGMSLRDYFASKAMQGDIAASANSSSSPRVDILAAYAYEVADAMLAEREKEASK